MKYEKIREQLQLLYDSANSNKENDQAFGRFFFQYLKYIGSNQDIGDIIIDLVMRDKLPLQTWSWLVVKYNIMSVVNHHSIPDYVSDTEGNILVSKREITREIAADFTPSFWSDLVHEKDQAHALYLTLYESREEYVEYYEDPDEKKGESDSEFLLELTTIHTFLMEALNKLIDEDTDEIGDVEYKYDLKKRILYIGSYKIPLSPTSRSKPTTLLGVLLTQQKTTWHNDQIADKWDLNKEAIQEKTFYYAAYNLNKKIAEGTEQHIDDFLVFDMKSVKINEKYLPISTF